MKKICVVILVAIMCISTMFSYVYAKDEEIQIIEFKESIEEFNNADCGIYRPTYVKVGTNGEWWKGTIYYAEGLVHLRIGLKAVRDYDITDDIIEKLNSWINQVREKGGTAIVRFAYDDFDGTANLEPDIEQIEKHILQLKPFFEANEDIIASVETGFLGPYGEQHTSNIIKDSNNIKRVTEKLLEVVPESRTVTVRRPRYYCYVTGVDLDTIDQDISQEGTPAYRIGVFNDGYLGSKTDLNTFTNREKEIAWLNNQATHTIYGGEVVFGTGELDENGNEYNSAQHIQEEMFVTHTSYLNEEWNDKIINRYKSEKYTGADELYNNSTVYTYVKNHLGYRLVLQNAKLNKFATVDSTANIELCVKNVGAGNVVNKKSTYIILKNEENEYSFLTDIDIRKLYSREQQNYKIDLPISNEIELGNYDIYLKIADEKADSSTNLRTIRFANEDIWNVELGANKIGSIEVKEKQEILPENNTVTEENNTVENKVANNTNTNKTNNNTVNNAKSNSTNSNKVVDNTIANTIIPNAGEGITTRYMVLCGVLILAIYCKKIINNSQKDC